MLKADRGWDNSPSIIAEKQTSRCNEEADHDGGRRRASDIVGLLPAHGYRHGVVCWTFNPGRWLWSKGDSICRRDAGECDGGGNGLNKRRSEGGWIEGGECRIPNGRKMENERARAGGEDPGEYACSGRAHCGVGAGMGVSTVFGAAHTVTAGVTCAVLDPAAAKRVLSVLEVETSCPHLAWGTTVVGSVNRRFKQALSSNGPVPDIYTAASNLSVNLD